MRRWSEISAQSDLVYRAAHLLQPVLVTDGTFQQCLILECVNAAFGRHAAAGRDLSVHTYIHCILVCMASDLHNEVQSIHILCMYTYTV